MSSTWGNARATYLARGVELPSHDSVRDRMMVELLQRERLAEIKKWEISLQAVGAFFGHKGKDVQGVVMPLRDKLVEELFHLGYDMKRLQAKMSQRVGELREQRERMEKINGLS